MTSTKCDMRIEKEGTTDPSTSSAAVAGMTMVGYRFQTPSIFQGLTSHLAMQDGEKPGTKYALVASGELNMIEKGPTGQAITASDEQNAVDLPTTVRSTKEMKFTCFPRLPAELRLKIWRNTFPGPRIVDTVFDYDDEYTTRSDEGRVRINQPPPMALRICRESRKEALKHYRVLLSTKYVPAHDPIDPTKDILYLQWCGGELSSHNLINEPKFMEKGVLGEIQYLAVDIDVWIMVLEESYNELLATLSEFTALREVTIVLHDRNCRDSWRMKSARVAFSEDQTMYLGHLLSRGYESLEEDVLDTFQELQAQYPVWEIPQVRLASLERGGEPCCYYDVRRAMAMPDQSDDDDDDDDDEEDYDDNDYE